VSDTKIDMAKVTQMLDNGWRVQLFRGGLGSYTAIGFHPNGRARDRLAEMSIGPFSIIDDDGTEEVSTDDFTPEQALTRLAYKVHGEII
jgi:hypothetical protein